MESEAALDLSLPKSQQSTSESNEDTRSSSEISSNNLLNRIPNRKFNYHEDIKVEDFQPDSKRRKFSTYSSDNSIPSTSYVSRNGEENEAYLSDDADHQPFPPLNIDPQCGELIKRTNRGVSVCLHDETLWRTFASFGTEMIINRGGRRMFPHIILSIDGLNPQMLYSVILEVVPADQRRYKFIHNQWMPMGMADPGPGNQPVIHPDSPNVGSFWLQNRASFSKVRLTNNKESSVKKCSDGNILLMSMHKYKVVIKIREENTLSKSELTFDFDESAFVAVTAYQNSQITQLKIQNNPFAKAFRDCHSAPFAQKSVSQKRRESKSKERTELPITPLMSPSISEIQKPESWPCPFPSLPFQHTGVNMAVYDQLCRDATGSSPMFPGPYVPMPWTAIGQHWPYPIWTKESQSLMSSLYSKTLAAMKPEVSCMKLPVDIGRMPDNSDTETGFMAVERHEAMHVKPNPSLYQLTQN